MHLRLRALLLLGLSTTPACIKACDAPAPAVDAGPGAASVHPDPLGPPSQHQLPTTDGKATVANLDGQIDALSGLIRGKGDQVSNRRALVPLLSARAQFLGKVADAERAAALADELVRDVPGQAWPLVMRASTRTAMHLFSAALADLDEAEKRGTPAGALMEQRAVILEGQGDLDAALAIRRAEREAHPDITSYGLEATLLGKLGRAEEAKDGFARAIVDYRNLSAFPIAWLFLQEGLFWESAGETDRARSYYQAAHDRLPAYGHAASHLALLVPPAQGIELLAPIAEASDDPEFEMILAGRLRAAGRATEADARAAHAGVRYAELVERHPEAYAEHLGFFLLDEGKDPGKAFALARINLTVRHTEKAYQLALLSALAAGKRAEACTLGEEARKLPHASEMLRGIAARACERQ
jgi:tetratricopeptide (TPR) repeat protein